MSGASGECPHAYWHPTQCPFCELAKERRELFVARLKVAELQRAYDVAASEAATLRRQRNAYKNVLRERRK